MKLTTLTFTALLPFLALTAPAPETPSPTLPPSLSPRDVDVALEKRAVGATVIVDGLRHRTCPRTSCSAPGQYAKGTRIRLDCYTRDNTTPVKGDRGWARVTGNRDWVALAFGKYVRWDASLPHC